MLLRILKRRWDAACHIGCHRDNCPKAHEPLPPIAKLDPPTVGLQVLRRGGLKEENKIDPKEVDGRIAQLRSQMKEGQAAKTHPKERANRKSFASANQVDATPVQDPAAAARLETYQGLKASGALGPVANCSPHLQSCAAARRGNVTQSNPGPSDGPT